MAQIETNVYEIENLDELSCHYSIYKLKGLEGFNKDTDDYYKNCQILIDKLSRITQSPCITYCDEGETFIVQPEGHQELPTSVPVVGVNIKIEKKSASQRLDFSNLTPLSEKLAMRFLQFYLQNPLLNNPALWQPQTGYPFYNKNPDKHFGTLSKDVNLYRGFTFRVIGLPGSRLGICVDTTSKYISKAPLPAHIERNEFRKSYEDQWCLYEYGDYWFEIRLKGLNDLNASELELPDGKTLYENVLGKMGDVKSQLFLNLPRDCSVLIYYNSRGEPRNAPSSLCKFTYGTDHPSIKRLHEQTLKSPYTRRREIGFVVEKNFRNMMFGSIKIRLSEKALTIDEEKILTPDIKFGNKKVLSVRKTPGTEWVSLEDFGQKKKQLLYSEEAGLYKKEKFIRQYFIMPRSIHQSFGQKFLSDIKDELRLLYPANTGITYDPILIPYEDSIRRTIYGFGKKIIQAIEENDIEFGFGVVMIPRISTVGSRKEDILGNLILRKLRERDIYVSIVHTTVAEESFEKKFIDKQNYTWNLTSDRKKRGRYIGYLKNVVLNKILLLNSHWPFVLNTPLNSDLTIGIDVKNNTAGFALIYKDGADIRFISSESDQKERLSKQHMCKKISDIIREEQQLCAHEIKNIVIHRDGFFCSSEMEGIQKAISILIEEKIISQEANVTFVEVRKTSKVPFRLFRIDVSNIMRETVGNPIIGSYISISENEFFICNSGCPFRHYGTTKPLNIIKVAGKLPLRALIEDVFYLSNLTWTKIDDCCRIPLSIKMTDIRLREIAGDYDEDLLKFGEDETEGEENE